MNGIENSVQNIPGDESENAVWSTRVSNEQISPESLGGYFPDAVRILATQATSFTSPELFTPAQVQSDPPKVAWLKANGLVVHYLPPRQAQWRIGRFRGASEEEVIAKFAKRRKLKLWYDMKQFLFTVENAAGQRFKVRGDGDNPADAFKDALKNVDSTFRPSSSGGFNKTHNLAVKDRDGKQTEMSIADFSNASPEIPAIDEPDFG